MIKMMTCRLLFKATGQEERKAEFKEITPSCINYSKIHNWIIALIALIKMLENPVFFLIASDYNKNCQILVVCGGMGICVGLGGWDQQCKMGRCECVTYVSKAGIF